MASEIRVDRITHTAGVGTITPSPTGVHIAGIVTGTTFSGSGASLTNLPAANLTGTVADARFPATLPAASGANLTNLPAANITGTLPAIDGSNLTGIDAGATGTGNDKIFWENGQTVTQSYTIGNTFGSANCNALSAGPITINNNVVVTVGSNSNWTIV